MEEQEYDQQRRDAGFKINSKKTEDESEKIYRNNDLVGMFSIFGLFSRWT